MEKTIVFKNTFYQIMARAITSLIGFLITIIIARHFGVLGYGDFTKITSFVAIFYLTIDLGLNAVFLQYENKSFKNFLQLRLLMAFIVFLVLNAVVLLLPRGQAESAGFTDSSRAGIFIFSFSIFFQAVILSSSAIFQKQLKYFYYMLGMVIGAVVNLAFVFILASLNYSIIFVLGGFVLSSGVSALILLFLTKERISAFSFDPVFAKEIFLKSLPIGLMLIFNLIYFRIDMVLLSLMTSTKDVGVYGLSYKFFDFLIAIPLFISNAVYPLLIKTKGTKEFSALTKKYFLIFLFFSAVLMLPFWFISPLFSLIKQDFEGSIIPFRILLISLPFFFTTCFLQWVLIALNKQKFLMYSYLLVAIVNILLNIIFIPKFSYIASAWLTVFSEGLIFAMLFLKVLSLRFLERKV